MEDDGLVLIDGKLWKPEEVSRAAMRYFERHDTRTKNIAGLTRHYSTCYPHPDLTTPTFIEFREINYPKGMSK